jgi:hypothetical protein
MSVESGDIMRVTAKMSHLGNDIQNVFHIRANGTGSVDDATAVTEITNRLNSAYGNVVDYQNLDYDYNTIEIFNVTQDRPMGEYNWPSLVSGTLANDALPDQTAALALFPTMTARSQGRKYVGGWCEAENNSGGDPDGDVTTQMLAWALSLIAPWLVGSGEFEFGNWSYTLLRFAEWLQPIIRDVWRTQRRRASGVGS